MKAHRRLEVVDIAEAPRGFLHSLDRRVDGFQAGVDEPMLQISQDIREVPSNQLGHRGHRRQAAVGRAPEPAGKEPLGRPTVRVVPEGAEAFPEGTGSGQPGGRCAAAFGRSPATSGSCPWVA